MRRQRSKWQICSVYEQNHNQSTFSVTVGIWRLHNRLLLSSTWSIIHTVSSPKHPELFHSAAKKTPHLTPNNISFLSVDWLFFSFLFLSLFFFLSWLSFSNQKSNDAFLFSTFGWNRKREVTKNLWCGIKRWSNMKETFEELMLFHSMYKRRKKSQ